MGNSSLTPFLFVLSLSSSGLALVEFGSYAPLSVSGKESIDVAADGY